MGHLSQASDTVLVSQAKGDVPILTIDFARLLMPFESKHDGGPKCQSYAHGSLTERVQTSCVRARLGLLSKLRATKAVYALSRWKMTAPQGMLTNSGTKIALYPLLNPPYWIMWGPAVVEVTWFPGDWRVASRSPCDWSILLKAY